MSNLSPELEKSLKKSSVRSSALSLVGVLVAVVGFAAFFLGRFSVDTVTEVKQEAPIVNAIPEQPPQSYRECRLPEHGIETWGEIQRWTANSGWRKGGSSPNEFCGAQKLAREQQYPDREVTLLSTSEKHKSEYTPFKHDFYMYECVFEDKENPIYNLRENPACGQN